MIKELLYMGISAFLILSISPLRKLYFLKDKNLNREENKRKSRYVFFDFLRGLAILAVIIIHVGDNFYVNKIGDQFFIILINNIARFAVPFFLISSGILLVRDKNLIRFFSKKIIRTFIPYFLLTVIIGTLYSENVKAIFYGLLSGNASPPYYFISILLQFYLIYPILEKYSQNKYFLQTTFIINVLSCLIYPLWSFYGVPLFMRFLFLFAYGISKKDKFLSDDFSLSLKEKNFWIFVLVYYLVATLYFERYFYNTRIFYAIALFNILFFYRKKISKSYIFPLFSYLGRNSLWIYLIHYFVVQWLYGVFVNIDGMFYLEYFKYLIITLPLSIVFSLIAKNIYQFFEKLIIKTIG